MRFLLLATATLLASVVSAVTETGLPKCAGKCVTGFGGCKQIDVKCICSNSALLAHLACCVSKSCSPADQDATIKFADAICAGQGVTDLPTTATCASTAASSSTTSGASAASAASSSSASTASAASKSSASAASAASSSSTAAASPSNAAGSGRYEGAGLGLVVAGLVAAL